MTLVLLALAAGVVAGYARGGGLARLATVRPRRSRLLLTALGLHALGVLGGWLWEPLLPVLVALSWAMLAYYAWVNRSIHGANLIALGLAANAFVMLVNGAMPVSASAAAQAGADPAAIVADGQHEIAGTDTSVAWLGKVVPVAFPPRPEVVTPGDVSIAAGVALALAMGLTGRRAPVRTRDRADHDDLDDGHDDEDQHLADDADDDVESDHAQPAFARDRDRADPRETMGDEAGPRRSAAV